VAAGGGLQQEPAGTLARDLTVDRRAGARWLRIDINWASIQMNGPSSYEWSAFDRVVLGAERRRMDVLGVLLYTPSWARPRGTPPVYAPSPGAYGAFAAAAVRHYAALGVHAYEVWNEPNTTGFWQPAPSPGAYTELLKAAYVAIKGADPSATVVTGGLSPALNEDGNYAPVDFLAGMYAAGAKGYFDAVGHHPYCWPAFPGAGDRWSAWFQMYGTSPSLRSLMVANGDGDKKIWATEFGAPTNGPRGTYVSVRKQAAMVKRAYRLFARYGWGGPLFLYQGRDLGNDRSTDQDFFGFLKPDFKPKPAYAAYREVAASL
jgi:hypothetical protein